MSGFGTDPKPTVESRDQRRTTCALCNRGIFPHHKAVWSSVGLIHDGCVEKEDG